MLSNLESFKFANYFARAQIIQHIDKISRYEDAGRRVNTFSASESAQKFGC